MSRRPNKYLQEFFAKDFAHAQVTTDTTLDLFDVPAGRTFVIDRVLYVNPTGLAASDTDYVTVKVLNNATVAASWSTKTTGGNGALVAGTQVKPVLSTTASDINIASGVKCKLFLDVTGAPTVPAGNIRVEGRLL